jgi:phosphoribulokinase
MSIKFPIISVTGSSGAGTTSVRHTFEYIFRRENVNAAFVQGDAFHRYDRDGMDKAMKAAEKKGNRNFSHFGEEANLLEDLEGLFRSYAATGTGRTRAYAHDEDEAKHYGIPAGSFTPWSDLESGSDLLLYEGLHGAAITGKVNIAQHADLKIGVVPVINLEWIQKISRDRTLRGYTTEEVTNAIQFPAHPDS